MTNEAKHTPGPWVAEWTSRTNFGPKEGWHIFSEAEIDGTPDVDLNGVIAILPDCNRIGGDTEANAAHIVKCVNMYDGMTRALEAAHSFMICTADLRDPYANALRTLLANTLAKAKEA